MDYTAEQVKMTEEAIAKYGPISEAIIHDLFWAYTNDDTEIPGHIAHFITETQDQRLVLVLLTHFVALILEIQERSHGPLHTLEEMGITKTDLPPGLPWQISAQDQFDAAVEHRDIRECARLMVDTQLQALVADDAEHPGAMTWEALCTGLALLDQRNLCVVAAEMTWRLANQEIHRER